MRGFLILFTLLLQGCDAGYDKNQKGKYAGKKKKGPPCPLGKGKTTAGCSCGDATDPIVTCTSGQTCDPSDGGSCNNYVAPQSMNACPTPPSNVTAKCECGTGAGKKICAVGKFCYVGEGEEMSKCEDTLREDTNWLLLGIIGGIALLCCLLLLFFFCKKKKDGGGGPPPPSSQSNASFGTKSKTALSLNASAPSSDSKTKSNNPMSFPLASSSAASLRSVPQPSTARSILSKSPTVASGASMKSASSALPIALVASSSSIPSKSPSKASSAASKKSAASPLSKISGASKNSNALSNASAASKNSAASPLSKISGSSKNSAPNASAASMPDAASPTSSGGASPKGGKKGGSAELERKYFFLTQFIRLLETFVKKI